MIIESFDTSNRVLVIAEIGNNHEGDANLAIDMVNAAAESGVDVVKVQIITPERLVNISQSDRITQLSKFKLPLERYEDMAKLAKAKGMLFMASAFDVDSLHDVSGFLSAIKVASSDLDYTQLLVAASREEKPIVLSTGMGTLNEVRTAVDTISKNMVGNMSIKESLGVLHCVSSYPAPIGQVNLRAMETLANDLGVTVGYSDHTLGIEVAAIAASLGARIIEKHFTLDKTRTTFRDHSLSADPEDMRRLTELIHELDNMMGSGDKSPANSEMENLVTIRRSIVAARDLPIGTIIDIEDLEFVRPGGGLPPSYADKLLQKKLTTPLKKHEVIEERHFN